MRWNFEETKILSLHASGRAKRRAKGPEIAHPEARNERFFFFKSSSHACLCLSPQGATAPLAAFLGPQQRSRPLRYRRWAKWEVVSVTPPSAKFAKNVKVCNFFLSSLIFAKMSLKLQTRTKVLSTNLSSVGVRTRSIRGIAVGVSNRRSKNYV